MEIYIKRKNIKYIDIIRNIKIGKFRTGYSNQDNILFFDNKL